MKKLTSIFGLLSVAIVILFSATPSVAQPTGKNMVAMNSVRTQNIVNNTDEAATPWGLSFNSDKQKLSVTQSDNAATPVNVTIVNTRGEVMYEGKASGNISNINIGGIGTGKYNVYLQSNTVSQVYKLLIL